MALIDLEKSRELRRLIEALTHSGNKDLNKEELRLLLYICKEEAYLKLIEDEIIIMLKKNHSEVRFSTVQLIHELFMKFDIFRAFILNNIHDYLKYTLGIDSNNELPPPKSAAKALRRLTLTNLLTWEKTFLIRKLKRAIKHLQNSFHVDFRTFEIVNPQERKDRENSELLNFKLNKERLKKMNKEVEELMPELRNTVTSLESCFTLLMPPPEDSEGLEETPCTSDISDLRVYGILNSKHSVQIELGNKITIKVDDENSAIIDAAKDAYTLINNRFLPKIKAWVEIINKADGGSDLMSKALGMESDLQLMVSKYKRLEILKEETRNERLEGPHEEEVSSDSDLEEVPEIKRSPRDQTFHEISFLSNTLEMSKKKTLAVERKKKDDGGQSTSEEENERKKKLLAVAPKVHFDVDLYHWEDKELPTPTMLAVNSEGSRFWGGATSEDLAEIPVPDGAALLRTRVIEFTGTWEPVRHTCRAPLASGKLCPRQDREKCPFHGLIVERDDTGQILNKEDEEKVAKSKPKPNVPDWQDPKLLAEIKAQTGVNLKMPEKGKRIKRKKYPGLTDIKEIKDTTEKRIAKKIFNKKSLKRVAESLDKIDHKKHRDKFGDQFNYVHGT